MKNKWMIILIPVIAIMAIGLMMTKTNTASAVERISPADYQEQFVNSNHFLLDVRTPEEFTTGHIPGAVNISLQTLATHLNEVPSDQPIIVYCRSGNRSASASDILADAGFTEVFDMGGILDWQAQGFPIE